MRMTVFGAGAWGTALAVHFAKQGHEVVLTSQDDDAMARLKESRANDRFLPGSKLPDNLRVEAIADAAVQGLGLALIATPAAGLRPTLRRHVAPVDPQAPVLIACKGFESDTGKLAHVVAAEEAPNNSRIGLLSGPTFAQEVARGLPAAAVLASGDFEWIKSVALELNSSVLRFYPSSDPIGVAVGGAVKNVIAIASGVADGLGYGLNARAGLITRGLAEIARLGVAMGARPETMMGLAGMGDLILTCTGDLSRNRQVGLRLAQGKSLQTILSELGHVAEGVNTISAVLGEASRLGVEMPIAHNLDRLLKGGMTAQEVAAALMSRDVKTENGLKA